MDVISFLLISVGKNKSGFMTVWVAYTHVHVQTLISVVKMATLLEKCTTEERYSGVRCFLWAKGINAKDMHK
jgi:hypothetical protein